MAGGIRESQKARFIPQASGVAPTLTVMIVTTLMKSASIRIKSMMIENRKAHPQLSTIVIVYFCDRLKPSAAPKTKKCQKLY
jgi:hypothetical protein